MNILDLEGLRYFYQQYIVSLKNDISAVSGDLTVTDQTVSEMDARLDEISQQVSGETVTKLSSVVSDIAKVSFQLDLKGMVDTSEMTHVIVDEIDAADAVVVNSGVFDNNRVYI